MEMRPTTNAVGAHEPEIISTIPFPVNHCGSSSSADPLNPDQCVIDPYRSRHQLEQNQRRTSTTINQHLRLSSAAVLLHSSGEALSVFFYSFSNMFTIAAHRLRQSLGYHPEPSRTRPLLDQRSNSTDRGQSSSIGARYVAMEPSAEEEEVITTTDLKSMNKRLIVFGASVILFGFLALFVVYQILNSNDLSSSSSILQSIQTSLRYRDTRVESMSPPEALKSAANWTFGDSVEELKSINVKDEDELKQRETRGSKHQHANAVELIGLDDNDDDGDDSGSSFLERSDEDVDDGDDIDDDDNDVDDDDARPVDFDEDEAADYNRDDPTVDESPIYFSDLTLQNREGEYRKSRDDHMCSKAGKYRDYDPERCLGAPYLYVTFHGGRSRRRIKNICKYSRDGCSLGSVLMPNSRYSPHSLRGMLHHQNFLFVAEAWRKSSKMLRFSHCNPALGHRRELLQVLVDTNDSLDEGMLHPYGFAKRADDPYIYVSAQATYSVLRYHHLNGIPGPMPLSLIDMENYMSPEMLLEDLDALDETQQDRKRERKGQRPLRKYRLQKSGHKLNGAYNGTFVDLGNDEVRGVAFDSQGLLYVANKQKGVMVFDKNGFLLGQLPLNVPNPISIYYCKERDSIWVGSARKHALYEYDCTTWEVMQVIKHRRLKHPAGFVSYGDSLYVVSQRKSQLLKFSMVTGRLEDVVLPWLPDAGERVLLSPC